MCYPTAIDNGNADEVVRVFAAHLTEADDDDANET